VWHLFSNFVMSNLPSSHRAYLERRVSDRALAEAILQDAFAKVIARSVSPSPVAPAPSTGREMHLPTGLMSRRLSGLTSPTAQPACNSVQGATATVAFTATLAMWNL
jgi:hypothetical protein